MQKKTSLPKWTHENNEQSFNARRGISADIERVMEKRREVSSKLAELSAEYRALLNEEAAVKNGVKFHEH